MLKEILENLKQEKEYICYQINDSTYTNKDLYKFVSNIYYYLLENNKEKSRVLVYGHKDIYMIATFLACSFAGITYIPVDNSVPLERKENIIRQAGVSIVIDKSIEKIMNISENKEISEIFMKEEDIYYIIYTSGSTGEPKGVKVTYKNLQSCMKWLRGICKVENSIILNQAIFSFDLSVADIYLSLLTRSKHVVLEKEKQKDYSLLFNEIKNSDAELAIITPSFAELLLLDRTFNFQIISNLKKILFCGEKLNKKTVLKLYERFPEIEIINSYGPTECTFAVTSISLNKQDLDEISIGVSKDDVEVFIVDENLNEVATEEIGEILISGESVSSGYVDETLNKNRFIIFNNKKAYLTGDLGYIKNNKIYCLGRKDKQIKYKGYRIELLEIENVLDNIDVIEKSIVIPFIKNERVSKIIGFVKLKENYIINETEVRKILENKLPEYMIPIIKIIKEIPLNINGKIDERKLLEEF